MPMETSALAGFLGALGFEPGGGFGFLAGFDRRLRRRIALGAQLGDQRVAVGAETLALRLDRQCANAQALAEYLISHPKVSAVHFPGLPIHPQFHRAEALFRAPGALLSFELAPGQEVVAFLNRLRTVVLSSNLGDNRTLAIPVAQTIYWEMGAARRAEMGIADSLVRVSVGIEDGDDLIADFAQALA